MVEDFIEMYAKNQLQYKILCFWSKHLDTKVSIITIATNIGENYTSCRDDMNDAIDEMVRKGLIEKHEKEGKTLYSLSSKHFIKKYVQQLSIAKYQNPRYWTIIKAKIKDMAQKDKMREREIEEYRSIGERLRIARKLEKRTQEECAKVLALKSAAGYRYYEAGQRNISIPLLKRIAVYLNKDLGFFLGDDFA